MTYVLLRNNLEWELLECSTEYSHAQWHLTVNIQHIAVYFYFLYLSKYSQMYLVWQVYSGVARVRI